MKSNTALKVVENNSFSSKDFTIQASGKMFHMVISGLYSNKPQSITREIWSNAFDAHAMVGKEDVPFDVTFPTSLSPTFTCRDFGPGIAHKDMEGFYTVLGHSTKENTNKAVGKWGVGRMSPMSYTDTFSVVSRHKGMVAYYSVQLGPDGSPGLHVLAEPTPTNEPDGLEVSFPVNNRDIHAFQTAADIVSYGFDVKPRVTNSKDKVFPTVEKLYSNKGYYLYKSDSLRGTYAQMGCVLYPIPQEYLKHGQTSKVFVFDIGELEVTASREALSFGPNDPTAESIKRKEQEVYSDLEAKLQVEIDAQESLPRAAKLRQKLANHLPNYRKLKYRGSDIPHTFTLNGYSFSVSTGYMGYSQKKAGWGLGSDVAIINDYTVFVQDTKDIKGCARAATRIGAYLSRYKYYVWVRADLTNPTHTAEIASLAKEYDYPVVYVKDLPDSGPITTGPREKVKVSRLRSGKQVEKWDMDDTDYAAGGYYYPMSNNSFPYGFNSLAAFVESKLGSSIVLVPKPLWKKFELHSEWKLVEPAIDAAIRKEAGRAAQVLGNDYRKEYMFARFANFKHLPGIVGDFARKAEEQKPTTYLGMGQDEWDIELRERGLPTIPNDAPAKDYAAVIDKYPLLKLYTGRVGEGLQAFADYIKLIDNANKE